MKKKRACLIPGSWLAILTTDTLMRHFEVHNNEQSHSISILDVPLCLLNQLSQLLFALWFLVRELCLYVCVFVTTLRMV